MEGSASTFLHVRDWPHSPSHRITLPGAYIVTAGTYLKQPFFDAPELLTCLTNLLLDLAETFAWTLQAWAVFPTITTSSANPNIRKHSVASPRNCTL